MASLLMISFSRGTEIGILDDVKITTNTMQYFHGSSIYRKLAVEKLASLWEKYGLTKTGRQKSDFAIAF